MRRLALFWLLTVFLCIFCFSSAFAERPSYVMICRGGGDMYAIFDNISGLVELHAAGGTRAASPGPGECVWVDRGMPLRISSSLFGISNSNLVRGINVKQGKIAKALFTNSKVQQLFDAVYYGRTFYVHARRKGIGNFEVTKIGP